MFNRNKVSLLEKEREELRNKLSKKDREYKSLQEKYLTLLNNSVQRDKKTGKYIKK